MKSSTPTKLAISAGFGLMALFTPAVARAAVITSDFSTTVGSAGSPFDNQTFSGSFAFDDAQTPSTSFFGEDLFSLQDFNFNFDGQSFNLNNVVSPASAVFFEGTFQGLDVVAASNRFSFVPDDGFTGFPVFNFTFNGGANSSNAPVTFGALQEVPTPALLPGLVGMGVAALRRRKQQSEESV